MRKKTIKKIVQVNTEPVEVIEKLNVRKATHSFNDGETLKVGELIKHTRVGKVLSVKSTQKGSADIEFEIVKGEWERINI